MRRTPSLPPSGPGRTAPLLAAGLGLAAALTLGLAAPAPAQPPGPESFGKTPTTPLELWDAADYLVRTGQAAQAVPYLNKFVQSKPDDATLIRVRDQYGARSILRLQDDPATRAMAEPLARMLAEATRRHATRPDRVARFLDDLTKSPGEQDYAVERLREAGPFAVPELLRRLDAPGLAAADRAQMVRNLGRLDRSAVPPLIAALDAAPTHPRLAADVAGALGQIGDPRAVPALTALAAAPVDAAPPAARDAARRAVARVTGRPFEAQPKSPVRLLTDEARRYHTHAIKFPGETVTLWVWDPARKAPVAATVPRGEAEGRLGLKDARAALAIDPTDRQAQVLAISVAMEKAVERAGVTRYPADDPGQTFSTALAAGPSVLGEVLRTAVADGKSDLAAAAATALGRVTDANAMAVDGQANPLVEALSAPGRRARFAAARALVNLDPRRPFAGSSRVVPVLAQFVTSQAPPRALVIDGNTARGSQLVAHLKGLGYEPVLATTGDEGFRVAADSADVELILVDIHMIAGAWRVHDTLANLRADARTKGIPIYLVGPLYREPDLLSMRDRFPGVKYLVTPSGSPILAQQLAAVGRPSALPPEERAGYAREAAALLARIGASPNSPFEPDLARVEPSLAVALNTPGTSLSASAALGDVPDPAAQRGLADVLIDASKPADLRAAAAGQLARSVGRFGPLVAADQEAKLLAAFDRESDPGLRTALAAVVGALRPKAAPVGLRLRRLALPAPVTVPAAPPSPGAATPTEPAPTDAAPAAEPAPGDRP